MMQKFWICGLLCLSLQSCTKIDDFMLGKDNTPVPQLLKPIVAQAQLDVNWSAPVGQAKKIKALKIKPLVQHKLLYFVDEKGHLQAINRRTGRMVWETSINQPIASGPVIHNGLLVLGTAAGTVMVLKQVDGQLVARHKVSGDVLSKPLLANHMLYAKTIDGNLYAFDTQSNQQLWVAEHGSPSLILQASSSPVMHNGMILVGYSDGKMDALDPQSGRVLWQKSIAYANGSSDVERLVDIDADPIVDGDKVYLATYQGYVGVMSLTNGDFLWTKAASVYKNMVMDQENLYYVDSNDTVWALSKQTGQVKWQQTALQSRALTAPALIQGRLVVGDKTGLVHIFSTDRGDMIGRKQLDSAVVTDPVISGQHVYVVTAKGRLYQLRMSN